MNQIFLTSPKIFEGTLSLPMIEFEQIADSIDFEGVDTLMFTSKQAVYTADKITKKWKNFDSIAIGSATKGAILSLGGKVIFQPKEFYGKSLARDILENFSSRKILYLRPEKITFDSRGFLAEHGVALKEQIIYRTLCKRYPKSSKPPKDSIIVFTSPSTIECFLKNFGWEESYRAVVIGNSTKEHLPKNAKFRVAKEPTIKASVEVGIDWQKGLI